jgi:very-short-patch-repair endonuclease
VVAEADGLLKYQSGTEAIKELKRDRLLREQDLDVIHFTWVELFREPDRVVGRILAAFAHARRLRQDPPDGPGLAAHSGAAPLVRHDVT